MEFWLSIARTHIHLYPDNSIMDIITISIYSLLSINKYIGMEQIIDFNAFSLSLSLYSILLILSIDCYWTNLLECIQHIIEKLLRKIWFIFYLKSRRNSIILNMNQHLNVAIDYAEIVVEFWNYNEVTNCKLAFHNKWLEILYIFCWFLL